MKKTKMMAVLVSFFITLTMICRVSTFAVEESIEVTASLSESKISDKLTDAIASSEYKFYPVVVWLNNVAETDIEGMIYDEIGYDVAMLEEEYQQPPRELLNKLQEAANQTADESLETLMQDYMNQTEESRRTEYERTDAYRSTRLSVVESLIVSQTTDTLKELEISESKVVFTSRYAPMSVCLMTQEEISAASKNEQVKEITLYEPIKPVECTIDLGTTTETMGINKINNYLSLTGNDVVIGIYETDTLQSTYYSTYGLDTSQVSIIGTPHSSDDHSTYCAGIAAGNNGVAPGANIYSASCESDWQNFDWDDYSNCELSSLETLISSGVDIVSISWGSNGSQLGYNNWTKYTDYLIANTGVTIVCATGNSYSDYIMSPSSSFNCIAVNGFIDNYNGETANILNDYSYMHGVGCFKPDVVAPSLNNGTSTATPYIAGMIALMYQYKPSLKAMPEITKAILLASCHEKCSKVLVNGTLSNLSESMTSGLTTKQGAGIPNMYRMISIVSQHCYGNGVLNSGNNYERYVNFVQSKYTSSYINVSMAYLQTNITVNSNSLTKDDCDLTVSNNSSTSSSLKATSSTEMVYKAMSTDSSYAMRIYKASGSSTAIRYGYAWSTNADVYYPSYEMDGMYLLKNYNSGLYLSLDTSTNKAYQASFANRANADWIMKLGSTSGSYWMRSASTSNSGLGLGSTISNNNYYAVDGSTSSTTSVTLNFDLSTGTYTIKRIVNGGTYALGIASSSTSDGAYANWQAYSANNASQKWYLETNNTRTGDVNLDGSIDSSDVTMLNRCIMGSVVLSGNYAEYMADVNRDGEINWNDSAMLQQILNAS